MSLCLNFLTKSLRFHLKYIGQTFHRILIKFYSSFEPQPFFFNLFKTISTTSKTIFSLKTIKNITYTPNIPTINNINTINDELINNLDIKTRLFVYNKYPILIYNLLLDSNVNIVKPIIKQLLDECPKYRFVGMTPIRINLDYLNDYKL